MGTFIDRLKFNRVKYSREQRQYLSPETVNFGPFIDNHQKQGF